MLENKKVRTHLIEIPDTKQGFFLSVDVSSRDNYNGKSHQKWLKGILKDAFGPPGKRYNYMLLDSGLQIRFRDEKDITWFMFKI